ncbi:MULTISPECIES: hypothetical protein [Pseudobutyrivibrio]|uniref:Uncharacterized protein n=1 Tax=Pseudobutyrivibrio xylanivorans TaxID=185007 RepID=A0A1G5RZD6_PSEXY|nr:MULTISPECIES: hypothetical protein [Pseudobutyrivibrio]MDC7279927.1 hypothetical protein [Butyrivibrio fibrisolvens]SCZ79505.1 hypothetical protein SAMN02910350_01806 [Pseudobutyrivibrio xylanivorans]
MDIRLKYMVLFIILLMADIVLSIEAIHYYKNREEKTVYVPSINFIVKLLVYGVPSLLSVWLLLFVFDLSRVITSSYKTDEGYVTDINSSEINVDDSLFYFVGDTSEVEVGDYVRIEYLPFTRFGNFERLD